MKYIPYIRVALLVLSVIVFVVGIMSFDSDNPLTLTVGLDTLFLFSALLLVLTACAALLMPIINLVQNPKSALGAGIGVGILAVIFIVAYSLAGDTPITLANGDVFNDVGALKFADTALFAMYIVFSGAILSILGTEIYKAFK